VVRSLRAFNACIRKRLDIVCAEVRKHNPTASNDERRLGNGDRTLAEARWRPGNDSDLFDLAVCGKRNVDDLSDPHAVRTEDRQPHYRHSARLRVRRNGRTQEDNSAQTTDVRALSHSARHSIISRNHPVLLLNAHVGGYKTVRTRRTFRSAPPGTTHRCKCEMRKGMSGNSARDCAFLNQAYARIVMRWRWMMLALPFCFGAGTDPGARLPTEVGVLSCTLAQSIDPQMSAQGGAASEARQMLCTFTPARDGAEETYTGSLKSISAGRTLPENVALLWIVRGPVGTRATRGLLEQTYAADPAAPPGHSAPLIGERNNEITLHTMSEQKEGSASMHERPALALAITAIALKLRASTS
jgi:hypothetical protein